MASPLSNLVDNLAGPIHKIRSKDCDYLIVKDNLTKCKYLSRNKDFSNKIDKEFKSTLKFSNDDFNKLVLLLRNQWEKFNGT